MIADLIKQTRSYRRFHQDFKIELETLKELVELARLSAAAGNLQPLKYMLSNDSEKNEKILAGPATSRTGPAQMRVSDLQHISLFWETPAYANHSAVTMVLPARTLCWVRLKKAWVVA
ncbi:MAG: nitroreductase family protein [Syntrophobacterales bacterium]|jgi:nitroreductase